MIGEKEGYILTGPLENGVFKAHKLAEVQVTLVDDENKPLQVRTTSLYAYCIPKDVLFNFSLF